MGVRPAPPPSLILQKCVCISHDFLSVIDFSSEKYIVSTEQRSLWYWVSISDLKLIVFGSNVANIYRLAPSDFFESLCLIWNQIPKFLYIICHFSFVADFSSDKGGYMIWGLMVPSLSQKVANFTNLGQCLSQKVVFFLNFESILQAGFFDKCWLFQTGNHLCPCFWLFGCCIFTVLLKYYL